MSDEEVLQREFRGRRVLLVEDEEFNREIMVDLLQIAHLSVDIARDGNEAITQVTDHVYDLILMDLQMPGMDGLAATRHIRNMSNGAAVPVLATTANAFMEDRQRCIEAGMDDFIAKPIRPDRLYRKILQWLSHKTSPNHDPLQPALKED